MSLSSDRRLPAVLGRVERIELSSSVWKTEALPLDDTRNVVPEVGLEPTKSSL